MVTVYDSSYKNIILNSFNTTGRPPQMIVEFYNNNTLIYTTTIVKGVYNPALQTVQLYAINPNPSADCTRVLWKDIDGNLKYEVVFSSFLTKNAMQVCHIVISYDPTTPPTLEYLEIPSEVFNNLLTEESAKVFNYYLENDVIVPQGRLYGKLIYEQTTNKFRNIVHVRFGQNEGKIRIIDGNYYLEI